MATVTALAIGVPLAPLFEQQVLLLLTLAVAVSAGIGGLRPSMSSLVLGGLASAYLFLEPHASLAVASASDRAGLGLFVLVGSVIGILGERQRRLVQQTRVHADEARRTAERYRLAIDTTTDAIWDWDLRTGQIAWNGAAVTRFGWQDVAGGTDLDWWTERIYPDDRARVIRSIDAAMNSGDDHLTDEYRFRCANGAYAEVVDRGRVLRDAQGRVVRIIGVMLDLTEYKRAMRDSEMRFRQLAENIRDVFWIYDLGGRRILYVSPGYERLWGMARQRLYEDAGRWSDVLHPEDRERVQAAFASAASSGQELAQEYRIVTPDGRTRWVRNRGFPVLDEAGKVYRFAGVAEDITERRHVESAQRFLLDLAERMSQTMSPLDLVELVTHAVGMYLDVSRCQLRKIDRERGQDLIERGFHRGLSDEADTNTLPSLSDHMLTEMNAGRVVVVEDAAEDPYTAARWETLYRDQGVRSYVAVPLLRNARWTATLWVSSERPRTWTDTEIALLRTVAERAWLAVENARLLEQTLTALHERDASLGALQESDTRLTLALQAAHVGTYDWDLRTDTMICSPEHAVLFGYPAGSFATRGEEVRGAVHSEDRLHFEQCLATAIAEHRDHHCEYRVVWPDGSVHWLEGRGRFYYEEAGDQAGQAVRMLGALVDVTDRKTLEAERTLRLARERAARADAEAANRAKDEFLAMLSHELRNPLGAISNAMAVFDQGLQTHFDEPPPMFARTRQVITRQLRHLVGVVGDLLDVARVTSGKIVLERKPLDLAEAVQRSLATATSATDAHEHRVVSSLTPVWLEGDETRIEQIIGNLVTNAVKYTPAGGTITVTVRVEDAHAVVTVQDTGIGIAEDMLPRLFELFAQGRRGLDRTQGGLGIGLTLVKRLVELHGGTIDAASDGPDRGSTFTLRLPRLAPPAEQPAADANAPQNTRDGCCVLVIEDDTDGREMLQELLAFAGHRAETASDGPSGVARALALRPEVALVDLGLPGFDGYEVARRIRAAEASAAAGEIAPDDRAASEGAMLLVALTGHGKEADRRAALDAGFDRHLTKPVNPEELLALLGRLQGSSAVAASGRP